MRRLWRLLKSLTRLRWRILPPRHKPVLLYFVTGADVIAPYFSSDEFQILDLREHEVNLWVALRCFSDRDLSATNYALRYIQIVKPKLVITFIDNFPAFFQLKTTSLISQQSSFKMVFALTQVTFLRVLLKFCV